MDQTEVELEPTLDAPEEADATAETEASDNAPVDAEQALAKHMREYQTALRLQPGDWYVIHSYSGHERKVKANLEQRAESLGMAEFIHEVVVPMEEVVEMKNAQRKKITRVRMPGYVMVRMNLDDDNQVLRLVKDTPAVTGFVGDSRLKSREDQIPTPLSIPEAYEMLAPSEEQRFMRELEAEAVNTPAPVVKVEYEIGESVMVTAGPFLGQTATVADVMPEAKKLVVTLTLFGRDTQTELLMSDVSKED
ncbi:transcription termination/antitermination factor NusG [Boudabousia marimammalium]|uniref:Transcription termination/antitermination protein NusG n=2 Tax=Boudabousia marimammalium TaxID=156892 RepID=A0A1Q5PMJ7_9ACTO|nr:transcription termination/antitermination factor NusG [Boudabousia marimammalium]